MSSFQPYKIHHIDLGGTPGYTQVAGPAVVYLWWKQIPLGHFWIDEARIPDEAEYLDLVATVIKPAINGYLSASNKLAIKDLSSLLRERNADDQRTFFSDTLSSHLLSRQNAYQGTISVVICTRNRAQQLEKCIRALANSTDTDFELIVVDNASDDDSTERVVKQFDFCRYVPEPRKGLDIARNTGARSARYPIVAYTDDDVQIEPGWVTKIKQCFTDPQVMAVTGQVFPVALDAPSQFTFERDWGFNKGYKPVLFHHGWFLEHLDKGVPAWEVGAGANMAFRKEVFDLVGYFDERLDVGASGCSGDSEFWYRIIAEGWSCYYCPQLFVYHDHRASDDALKNQIFHYMRGHVSALLVQYECYGHRGNLRRLYRALPKLYIWQLARWALKRRFRRSDTTMLEIKGCFSGYEFYQGVKHNRRKEELRPAETLHQHATVTEHTLVSIVITCYNYGHYLASAIESCLAQTWKNIEVIVVDDGSTDDTAKVPASFPQVKYVYTHRVGLSAARNIGVQYSTGSYITFLDADDWLYPNAIELNLHYFKVHPESVFVSGGHDKFNPDGSTQPGPVEKVRTGNNYFTLLTNNYIGMEATVLYRRDVFPAFHFNTKLTRCEDYDLNLSITKRYPTCSYPDKIAGYRLHGNNMSANKKDMLSAVMCVLDKFYANAETTEEKEQIELGKKNWQAYYNTLNQ